MKFGFDWNESSTHRGAVWLVAAIIGFIMVWQGRDVSQLLLLAAGVSGGIGVITKDRQE